MYYITIFIYQFYTSCIQFLIILSPLNARSAAFVAIRRWKHISINTMQFTSFIGVGEHHFNSKWHQYLGVSPKKISQRWVSYHPGVSISNQSRELVKIQWSYQTPAVCFNLNHEFETVVKNTGDPYCWGQRVILPPCTRDYKLVGDLDCNPPDKEASSLRR